MKAVMIFPHPESEKGISNYSSNLVESLKKQKVDIEGKTFIAGKPFSL